MEIEQTLKRDLKKTKSDFDKKQEEELEDLFDAIVLEIEDRRQQLIFFSKKKPESA